MRSFAGLILFLITFTTTIQEAAWGIEPDEVREEVTGKLRALSIRHSVEIQALRGSTSPESGLAIASEYVYKKYVNVLEKELAIYPPGVLKKFGIKRILLCGGIKKFDQHFGGWTERLKGEIVYDAKRLTTNPDSPNTTARLGIHHEIFHVLDDEIYFDRARQAYSDPGWKAINQPGFVYYIFGGAKIDPIGIDHSVPGFLTGYSRHSIMEDKAELFCWKIVRPDLVDRARQTDEWLDRKNRRLEKIIKEFCPEIDDAFWGKRVAELECID